MAFVHGNLLRPPLLDQISQLGRRSLATIPDYLIVEFLLSYSLGLQTPNNSGPSTVPLDDRSRPPCQIAEPKILGERVFISLPGKRDPHVDTLLLHSILDELELPAEKLHPERRAIQLHVDAVVTTGLIILPDLRNQFLVAQHLFMGQRPFNCPWNALLRLKSENSSRSCSQTI